MILFIRTMLIKKTKKLKKLNSPLNTTQDIKKKEKQIKKLARAGGITAQDQSAQRKKEADQKEEESKITKNSNNFLSMEKSPQYKIGSMISKGGFGAVF